MSKKELIVIEIPNYMLEVCISKKRRPKYDEDGNLTNKRTVGKPRMMKINGQSLWVTMNHNLRSKIAKELKYYLYQQIKDIPHIEEYPIGVDMEFYLPYGDYDIDNICLWWRKCFQDALAGNIDYIKYEEDGKTKYLPNHTDYPPKIPDDNVRYIQEANNKFIPVDSMDNRKLLIRINAL